MKNYNTEIAKLGTIPDINIIFKTINFFDKWEDINETKIEFVEKNSFGINMASTRKSYFGVIRRLFLDTPEDEANNFFIKTIASENPDNNFRKGVLYLEVFRKNDLFQDITLNLVKVKNEENRKIITTKEVFDFLLEFGKGTKIADFSESTIKRMASRYISFMKRVGYFQKESRIKSSFNFPYPDPKIVTYIVYLLKTEGKADNEVYNSNLFKSFMLTEEKKLELLKKGSLAGYYDFSLSGNKNTIIELNYKKEEIIDELFEKEH